MSLDPYAPPPPPTDLNDVFSRPAAPPPSAPAYPAARARPISTPPPWTGPEGAAFIQSSYEAERQAARSKNITFGALLLVVGIIVTAVTYDSASQSGGTYIVAWGPMVYGAIRLFKGLAG